MAAALVAEAPMTMFAPAENPTERMDQLLEQYLDILDQYQSLQRQLTSCLSSGYMSLAQANFTAPSRLRYGQDFYDDRMQAQAKIMIEAPTPSQQIGRATPHLALIRASRAKSQGLTLTTAQNRADTPTASPKTDPESEPEPPHTTDQTKEKPDLYEDLAQENPIEKKTEQTPLRWFGILVPPALRKAQADFVQGVDLVPRVVEMRGRLEEVEGKIRMLRGRFGGG